MPHVLELPAAAAAILYKNAVPALRVKVVMTCRAKVSLSTNANGSHNFSSTYQFVTVDLTNRISMDDPIRVVTKIPGVPTGKGNSASGANVTVSLLNPDLHLAVAQDGSIIDGDSIRNARVKVYNTFGGQEIQVYEGRVIGNPEEERGKTIFTIRDAVADLIDKPVKWENLNASQKSGYVSGVYEVSYYTENNVRFFDAYTRFDYRGFASPAVTASGTGAGLLFVDFSGPEIVTNSLDISTFHITFLNPVNFRLSGPNVPDYFGSVEADFITPFCKIRPSDWLITGDPSGSEITFQTFYTASGNPISIIKRVIEHAYLGTWGNTPTQPDYLPVDWATLDYLEDVYNRVNVFVSETNSDPTVYTYTSDSRPLSAKNLIEYLCEHIGCYLTTDTQGRITLTNHYLSPANLLPTLNSDMVSNHKIVGNLKKYDAIRVSYGYDASNGSSASEYVYTRDTIRNYDPSVGYVAGDIVNFGGVFYQAIADNPPGVFTLEAWTVFYAETYRTALRYFKTGASDAIVQHLTCNFLNKVFTQHEQITCEILPHFGLAMTAGDRVYLQLSESPARTIYAEAIRVSKITAGNVVATFQRIEQPQKPGSYCSGNWCDGVYLE